MRYEKLLDESRRLLRERLKARRFSVTEALGGNGHSETEPWTNDESRKAKTVFECDPFLFDRGWILPDGTVLDFRPKSGLIEHMEIFRAFSDRRKAKTGLGEMEIYDEALKSGLIRFGSSQVGIYVEAKKYPTAAQLGSLYEIADMLPRGADPENLHSYVECGRDIAEYSTYDEQRRRLVNDVKRFTGRM